MAKDPSVGNGFLIETDQEYAEHLYGLREFENLIASVEAGCIMITGFNAEQFAVTAKIPFTNRYELRDELLFFPGRMVPEKKLSSALQWQPLQSILTVERPAMNHNYFGLNASIKMQLIAEESEQPSVAMVVDEDVFTNYIDNAPAVRLQPLQWTRFTGLRKVLVMGTPLLPIPGTAFWLHGKMLMPAGFTLNHLLLATELEEMLAPASTDLLIWIDTQKPSLLKIEMMERLSRGSARLTFAR